jgi:diacylglycerol kinase family enzyme
MVDAVESLIAQINSSRDLRIYLSGVNCRECHRVHFHSPWTLEFSTSGRSEKLAVSIDDIVSVRLMDSSAVILAMVFPGQWDVSPGACGCGLCHPSKHKDRLFVSISITGPSIQVLTSLVTELNVQIFGNAANSPSKAIVLVNPVSGRGQARKEWDKTIEPILNQCNQFDISMVRFTEHKNHAFEIVREIFSQSPPTSSDGLLYIIAVGGDGLVFEIYNGIREAAASANTETDYRATLSTFLDRVVVCPLPCGSGNGLCYSTLGNEPFTINCALRQLIRKKTKRRDLGLVSYRDDDFSGDVTEKLFSLTISWGLVADVDILSEPLRFLGDSRFTIYGLLRVLRKSTYEGIVKLDNDDTIAPDFLTVYASIVPVAGGTVILSPSKPMDSGKISVFTLLERDTSRLDLVDALTELSKRREHEKFANSLMHANRIEIVPAEQDRGRGAGIVVDGEPLTRAPVSAVILPKITHCLA